jgi:hypothetical protein
MEQSDLVKGFTVAKAQQFGNWIELYHSRTVAAYEE